MQEWQQRGGNMQVSTAASDGPALLCLGIRKKRKVSREKCVEHRRHAGAAAGARGTSTASRTEEGERGVTVERNGAGRASAAALEGHRKQRGRRGTKRPATAQLCLQNAQKHRNAFECPGGDRGVSGRSPMTGTK
ncbi:hypothetical protein WwAna1191 [Wolbachia endosymbiont of Drosophila ananassae]|nr:hypothetical protein WwAna1191 [Wolbachia endosymbiont of Drosophila ananassae]